jgi:uncharacterized protein YqjF (DUF2071 family)
VLAEPPQGGWLWSQIWHDLFFAHWQVPPDAIQPQLPACCELDTWHGEAWLSIVVFRLQVRHRWLSALGLAGNFLEMNLRTYVRFQGEPGIFFLSIHADRRLWVALACMLTPLPYVFGHLQYCRTGHQRKLRSEMLDVEFNTVGLEAALPLESLDEWLLERYRAFVPDGRGGLYRLAVQHPPWRVGHATTRIHHNLMGAPWSLNLQRQPDAAHFAERMPALLWPFEKIHAGLA